MFAKAHKSRTLTDILLTPEEDQLIRDAFGRYKKEAFRNQGEAFIAELSSQGYWLACDCRPDETRPPFLTTVLGRYIRREKTLKTAQEQKPTDHAEGCDFEIDADEQRRRLPSYRRSFEKRSHSRFKILPSFPLGRENQRRSVRSTSFTTRTKSRSKLAQLLCHLLDEADLSFISSEEGKKSWREGASQYSWNLAEQIDRIKDAAQHIYIAPGIPLSDYLATSFAEFVDLKQRLIDDKREWPGSRPHGIFLHTFSDIDDNFLVPYEDGMTRIVVNGTVTISKEGRDARRGPYLVASLVAKLRADASDFEIVRAYAHPCVSNERFTLIDSNMERRTLYQILTCRDWLRKTFDIRVEIEKPLFDIVPDPKSDEDSRPVCIPDFILRSIAGDPEKAAIVNPTIVVETMGIWSTEYRKRKERMQPYFEAIDQSMNGRPAAFEKYDPIGDHQPEEETAAEFWRRLMKLIAQAKKKTTAHTSLNAPGRPR